MAATVLRPAQVDERLAEIPGWDHDDGALHRTFTFGNFVEAFGFMTQVALVAEKLDHHPDWSNSWNKVDVRVVNHQAGGITDLCFMLAAQINKIPMP